MTQMTSFEKRRILEKKLQKIGYTEISSLQIVYGISYEKAKQISWMRFYMFIINFQDHELAIRLADRMIALQEEKYLNPIINKK